MREELGLEEFKNIDYNGSFQNEEMFQNNLEDYGSLEPVQVNRKEPVENAEVEIEEYDNVEDIQ